MTLHPCWCHQPGAAALSLQGTEQLCVRGLLHGLYLPHLFGATLSQPLFLAFPCGQILGLSTHLLTMVRCQIPSLCTWLKNRAFLPCPHSSEQARWTREERGNPLPLLTPSGTAATPWALPKLSRVFEHESPGKALHPGSHILAQQSSPISKPPSPCPRSKAGHMEIYWMPNRISNCGWAGSSVIGLQSN